MSGAVSAEQVRACLAGIEALYARAGQVDLRPFAFHDAAATIERDAIAPLAAIAGEGLVALGELQALCDGECAPETSASEPWGEDFELEFTAGAELPRAAARSAADELWRVLGDTCFTAAGDLKKAQRALGVGASHEDRVVGCDGARRKIRRALRAVIEAHDSAVGSHPELVGDREHELEAGLAVRRMYAKFRRSLVTCDDAADAACVRRALRYGAVAFAVMVGSTDFSEVRMSDRRTLLGLQARILDWARSGSDAGEGWRLYKDITAAADLLRSVNMRQELVAHDAVLLRSCRERLLAASGDGPAPRDVLEELRGLQGRDDELDGLLAHAYRGGAIERSVLHETLRRLGSELRVDAAA
jgi:hypothetical protein